MTLTKVVLSPCVFELMTENESETVEMAHLTHLQDILDYVSKLNIEFDLYDNAPYYPDATKRPPISRYHYFSMSITQLYAKIQKKIAYEKCVSLANYETSEIITDYSYPEESETKESFLKYITFLEINSSIYLLFIGEPNRDKPKPIVFKLPDNTSAESMPIYDPATDCSGQLSAVLPAIDDLTLFPNSEFCRKLNCEFMKRRDNGDRRSLIREYGNEAAIRNGYELDQHLSMINSRKQSNTRTVYRRIIGNKESYLSLDYESGGFEAFDHTGTHLGQFSFDGIQVKSPNPGTHKLFFS